MTIAGKPLPHESARGHVTGGALYTVGAMFYATRWPNPWPRTFGYHEFFHAATVLAALCHLVAIWLLLFR